LAGKDVTPLPLAFSISQNQAKDQALATLPPVAALLLVVHNMF
jgi:hypothetical protein